MQDLTQMLPPCAGDVVVTKGIIPPTLADARCRGVLWEAGVAQLLLTVPETARLLICRDEIVIEPLVPEAFERLGRLLRRTPLAALLWLRDAFACHGAAVEINGGAVLLLGGSGVGKSSLAAALVGRGARLLADDVAPVMLDETGHALIAPVWPELVLWPDAVQHFFGNSPPPWLTPATPDYFAAPYWAIGRDRFCDGAVPLNAIYCLVSNRLATDIAWTPVGALERLTEAALLPYHEKIAMALFDRAARLRLYGAIADVPYRTVTVPHLQLAEIDRVADGIIEAHHG